MDYSLLDDPRITQSLFYPRRDWAPPQPGVREHLVTVEAGVSLSCRFYPSALSSPSILFFHGNGEVVSDYDWVAPYYQTEGINLFVADYRGYGMSDGAPSFSSMMADAHAVLRYFHDALVSYDYSGPLFVMGRSLGSHSAVELAASHPDQIKGLIMESGFANAGRVLRRYNPSVDPARLQALEKASLQRIHSLSLPVLVIYGDCDTLVPPDQALSFYELVGSPDKRLVTIPGAGHNDILVVGATQYFAALKEFVAA